MISGKGGGSQDSASPTAERVTSRGTRRKLGQFDETEPPRSPVIGGDLVITTTPSPLDREFGA